MTRDLNEFIQLESTRTRPAEEIDRGAPEAIDDAIAHLLSWVLRAAGDVHPDEFLRQHGDLCQVPLSNISEVRDVHAPDFLVELVDQTIRESPLTLDSHTETLVASVTFVAALRQLYSGFLGQAGSGLLPLQARTLGRLLLQRHAKIGKISVEETSSPYIEELRWRNYVSRLEEILLGDSYWLPNEREWEYHFTRYNVGSHDPFPYRRIIEAIISYTDQWANFRRRSHREKEERISASRVALSKWQEQRRPPGAQRYGTSHLGAEGWVRDWCVYMGMEGATLTPSTGDGGIDIESPFHIVQVKNYQGAVPIREVREMVGVAALDGRRAHFFTSGTYPASTDVFAANAGLSLFQYDVVSGQVKAMNSLAEDLLNGRGFLASSTDLQE